MGTNYFITKVDSQRSLIKVPVVGVCVFLYLRRRQILLWLATKRFGEQFASQDSAEVFGHDSLLLYRTMILQGQD